MPNEFAMNLPTGRADFWSHNVYGRIVPQTKACRRSNLWMAINFGVGQCVDIFMRAGEMSCSMPLENDRWVLATIAAAKTDRILVHVSGGAARWLPRQSDELAAPGVHTGFGLARAASQVEVFFQANNGCASNPKYSPLATRVLMCQEMPVVDAPVPTNYLVTGVRNALATPLEQQACEAAQNVHSGEKRKKPSPP